MKIFKLIRIIKDLLSDGPLVHDGWFRSRLDGESVNSNGSPIPWITYPAFDFLSSRLPYVESVFEYGSGNGTLWWSTRSSMVRSIENDSKWYTKMTHLIPSNVELFYENLDNGANYEEKILIDNRTYDIVVIDGRKRNNCINHSLKRLKSNGIIILDNSDREKYRQGRNQLFENGFKSIEFSGLCPIVNFKSQTSIFYRSTNILGI